MKKVLHQTLLLLVVTAISGMAALKSQPSLDIETGFVSAVKNDVRIPGSTGTLFSMTGDLTSASSFFYRIKAGYRLGDRHNLSILAAPLTIKSDGFLPYPVTFSGVIFPADSMLDARYKFNSYRLTYRYDFILRDRVEFGAGITAKIRDAAIKLRAPSYYAEKTNSGFVPLINFRFLYKFDDRLSLLIDGDALAAKQGRAEDILFSLQYELTDEIKMRVGYRFLEGGTDGEEVYNFSMFNYGSLGFTYNFN